MNMGSYLMGNKVTDIQLQPGDVFASENPMALGSIINWVQRNTNRDGKSKYTHVGFIINGKCNMTFEALWTYRSQKLMDGYRGKDIVIFRHKDMTPERFKKGWKSVKHLAGKRYPWWRLPMFLIPGLARISLLKMGVCSELWESFFFNTGLGDDKIFGVDPDDVVDACRSDVNFTNIFEGKCE